MIFFLFFFLKACVGGLTGTGAAPRTLLRLRLPSLFALGAGLAWSRNFIPMDPDEIPLGPEAARISLRFPKANFGRIGLDAGDPLELPWPLRGQSGS